MSFWLQVWLSVCGGAFVLALSLRWIVGPVRVHAKVYAVARLKLMPTDESDLSPETREFYERFFAQFRDLGFEGAGLWSLGDSVAGATGVTSMMSAPTGDVVHLIAVRAASTRGHVVSIRSKFWDGSAVVTTNAATLSGTRRNPRYDTATFAWVRDAATLVEVHSRRLAAVGKADTRRIDSPDAGDEPSFIQRGWTEDFEWQVASGYRYLDTQRHQYWLTWKGAFLLSWKLTQPVKRWLLARRDRKMRALWRSLRMENFSPPPQAAVPIDEVDEAANGSAPDSDPSLLRYEVGLQEGELRQQQQGRTLVIRMGGPSAKSVMRRQLTRLFFASIYAFALGATVVHGWMVWRRLGFLPAGYRWQLILGPNWLSLWWALAWLVFLAMDVRRIVRDMRQARGTAVLSASHAGISFNNAPGAKADGDLRRQDIEGLFVRLHRFGFAGRRYRLDARLFAGGVRVLLLVGKDRAVLDQARLALFDAMGMATPVTAKST